MNEYIAPSEFMGLTMFEDEHPLMEREADTGKRNVIIYHTAGQKVAPLKELAKDDITGKIYYFHKIEIPEEKSWNNLYSKAVERVNESGQSTGHYIATASSSDNDCKGHQLAVCVKYDLAIAENLKDLRG